jgi:hypothetical protein
MRPRSSPANSLSLFENQNGVQVERSFSQIAYASWPPISYLSFFEDVFPAFMYVVRFINRLDAHHKLVISLIFGSLAVIMTTFVAGKPINWMIGWLVYGQDSNRIMISLFVIVASFVSLFAILFLLQGAGKSDSRSELTIHLVLSFSCIICSWILVHTIFTLRYAHLYYRSAGGRHNGGNQQRRGLEFPNETEPDYLDFTYFSFVIGMTFQVSDVTISSRELRRLALVHALLSFAFNTLLVALTINVVSGLIQSKP